jgi:Chalcone isomerase-like
VAKRWPETCAHVKFILILLLLVPSLAWAVKVGETELPDTWTLNEQTLILNGAGIREYSFLRIPVYAAALYLPARQQNESAILKAITPRVVHMKMLRDATREDSAKAWDVYLAANCKSLCVMNIESRQKFLKLIPDTRAGDTQTFVFREGELEIFRNGKSLGAIADTAFTVVVLASWIGNAPTTEELKRRLLGITQ